MMKKFIFKLSPKLKRDWIQLQEKGYVELDKPPALENVLSIHGPEGTPYEGGIFQLRLQLCDYDMKSPALKFDTPLWHLGINELGRIIKVNELYQASYWDVHRQTVTLLNVIENVITLLKTPTPPPVNKRHKEYLKNPEKFQKLAIQYTDFYAKKIWYKELHHLTPPKFKQDIKMLLLILNRLKVDSRDLLIRIAQFLI